MQTVGVVMAGRGGLLAQAAAAAIIGSTPSHTAIAVSEVKAQKQRRWNRQRNKNQKANVQWRRIKDNFDELVAKTGANPEIGSVVTRWVLYGHLTKPEGLAGRLTAEIIGRYEHFWNAQGLTRTAASQAYQRGTGGRLDEIAYHETNGTIAEYERRAARAKKRYERLCRVIIGGFGEKAWETLVEVCVSDREVESNLRDDVAIVLRAVAKEFGLIDKGGRPKKRQVWRA